MVHQAQDCDHLEFLGKAFFWSTLLSFQTLSAFSGLGDSKVGHLYILA